MSIKIQILKDDQQILNQHHQADNVTQLIEQLKSISTQVQAVLTEEIEREEPKNNLKKVKKDEESDNENNEEIQQEEDEEQIQQEDEQIEQEQEEQNKYQNKNKEQLE